MGRFSGTHSPDRLARALQIRDPEKRCLALLRLLPALSGVRRATAARAALDAARAVKISSRREALVNRLLARPSGQKRMKGWKGGAKRAGTKRAGTKRAAGTKKAAAKRAETKRAAGTKKAAAKRAGTKRAAGTKKAAAKRAGTKRAVGRKKASAKRSGGSTGRTKLGGRNDKETRAIRVEREDWADSPVERIVIGGGDGPGEVRRRTRIGGDNVFLGDTEEPKESAAGRPTRPKRTPSEGDVELGDEDEAPARPVVNLGFSTQSRPTAIVSEKRSLQAGGDYFFWVEVGPPVHGSLTDRSARLPVEQLPADARLDVVIFANPRGFIVRDHSKSIVMSGRSQFRVAEPRRIAGVTQALLRKRLFFPIHPPWTEGQHRLRCCIYCRGLLVQSYDVEVLVEDRARTHDKVVQTWRLDYTLSRTFDPRTLAAPNQPEHRLSILFNDDGKGTHAFRFVADKAQYCRSASFDAPTVQDLIERARSAFREVSWGNVGPWQPGMAYRYDVPTTLVQLTTDLARLAIAGYRNYDAMIERIDDADRLAELMRRPGAIQLALKDSTRLILPLSIIYDHRLDADAELGAYTLCPTFVRNAGRIEDTPCFRGDCPHRDLDNNHIVCPSGFWGFRHEIGVPPSLGTDPHAPEELPSVVKCAKQPIVVAAVSADPDMQARDAHLANLSRLFGTLTIADSRAKVLQQLRTSGAHIMYFYCHGGVDVDRSPFLQVGPSPDRISRSTLRAARVRWTDPRALVFLNGCHTTDLEPERAIELVSGFVQTARGSGVIGTEITVFEPLAVAFAEAFMARLLDHATVGAAIRSARLKVLAEWNPLGLLYVPFAMATLRIGAA